MTTSRKNTLRIGTRGSMLALRQAENVGDALKAQWPDLNVEYRVIKTKGDKILDVPLAKVGGKGLFVKEIEEALLAGAIDLAVHSMKDVPSELPEGLDIVTVPEREDPRDALVAAKAARLEELPAGAGVGTSSLRRGAQLMRLRPDLRVETLRGSLDTRLRKVEEGQYDAAILAAAGMHRMGWRDRVTAYLEPDEMIPAIGQGALGIEARLNDEATLELLAPLHDETTAIRVTAERALLKTLEGGCQVPIGGHAVIVDGRVRLTGMVSSLDGKVFLLETGDAAYEDAGRLGVEIAHRLLEAGGAAILREVYASGTVKP